MAVPVAHLAVGMGVPFALGAVTWILRPGRKHPALVYLPFLMFLCGGAALLPKLIGYMVPSLAPVLAIPVLGDMFFFHATLTRFEPEGSAWGMMLATLIWFCVVVGYIRCFAKLRSY